MCKILSTIVIDHVQTPSQAPGYAEIVKNFKFISDKSQITDDVPMAVVVWDNYDFGRKMALLKKAMEKGTWVTMVTFGTGFIPTRRTWWDKNASLVVSISADGSIDFDAEGERYALSPDEINKQLTRGFESDNYHYTVVQLSDLQSEMDMIWLEPGASLYDVCALATALNAGIVSPSIGVTDSFTEAAAFGLTMESMKHDQTLAIRRVPKS